MVLIWSVPSIPFYAIASGTPCCRSLLIVHRYNGPNDDLTRLDFSLDFHQIVSGDGECRSMFQRRETPHPVIEALILLPGAATAQHAVSRPPKSPKPGQVRGVERQA
jgi:hypothetical protein